MIIFKFLFCRFQSPYFFRYDLELTSFFQLGFRVFECEVDIPFILRKIIQPNYHDMLRLFHVTQWLLPIDEFLW